MKLTKAQQTIVDKMRNGWKLIEITSMYISRPSHYELRREPKDPLGSNYERLRPNVVDALRQKKAITTQCRPLGRLDCLDFEWTLAEELTR